MPNHPDPFFNQKIYGKCPNCDACVGCTIDDLGGFIECHHCKQKIQVPKTLSFEPDLEDLEKSYYGGSKT